MKVFFLASNAADKNLRASYKKIVQALRSEGNEVFYQQPLPPTEEIEKMPKKKSEMRAKEFLRDMLQCDCVVFDGTRSTTGGGYYLCMALQHSLPVLYLTQNEYRGLYIASSNRLLKIKRYYTTKQDELKNTILDFLKFANKKKLSNRFNLMISDSMDGFLNKVSQDYGTSKADFIRDLIYTKMEKIDK